MKAHIKEVVREGKTKFVLTINYPRVAGKRKRERFSFDTKSEAEGALKDAKTQSAETGMVWTSMSALDRAEAMIVIAKARALGTTLRGLLTFYEANSGAVARQSISLIEMVNYTIRTKTTSRRRQRYVDQLKYTLERFARGREAIPLRQITAGMVMEFLASQQGRGGGAAAGDTIMGVITRLRTMFSLACKNNTYLDAGLNPMESVELPYVDSKAPIILTPEQAGNLLWVCRATDLQFLPYLVLGMFAGIRPEELEKLRWCDIHLEDGEIVIEQAVSKVRARRVFDITFDQKEPTLMLNLWLEEVKRLGLIKGEYIFECEVEGNRLGPPGAATEKILRNVRQCIRRHRKRLCLRAGFEWHQDILRKTAASFLMWKYENETKVSSILGNSPTILHEHYRANFRRREGEAFENLAPDKVKNDPLELPKGGKGKKAGVLIPKEEKTE